MRLSRTGLAVSLMTLSTLALSTITLALPKFSKDFASTYGIKKESTLGKAGCTVCHVGKTTKLNAYGLDLQKAMKEEKTKLLTGSVLKKVEGLDSDKDEVENVKEIHADTLPGDPKSKK